MKNYVNKIEKDGEVRYTVGVKYTNKDEQKIGFIPVIFSKKAGAPENKSFIQIEKVQLGVGAPNQAMLKVSQYSKIERGAEVPAPEAPIIQGYVKKDDFGRYVMTAKEEYNGKKRYASLILKFTKSAPAPEADNVYVKIKDAFLGGYDGVKGFVPTLVVTDYEYNEVKATEENETPEAKTEAPAKEVENVENNPFEAEGDAFDDIPDFE